MDKKVLVSQDFWDWDRKNLDWVRKNVRTFIPMWYCYVHRPNQSLLRDQKSRGWSLDMLYPLSRSHTKRRGIAIRKRISPYFIFMRLRKSTRDWVIKNWTDILVSYANDFESAILDLYFPKTTQNFCSSAILHISITFIQF